MTAEYKVIPEAFYWTVAGKAQRIQAVLDLWSPDGWELAAIDPVTFLGFDVGFCVVLKREAPHATESAATSDDG